MINTDVSVDSCGLNLKSPFFVTAEIERGMKPISGLREKDVLSSPSKHLDIHGCLWFQCAFRTV